MEGYFEPKVHPPMAGFFFMFMITGLLDFLLGGQMVGILLGQEPKTKTIRWEPVRYFVDPYLFSSSLPASPDRPRPIPPIRKDFSNMGVDITGRSAIVMDQKTKAVLFAKDADTPMPIASITKLVSLLVVLDANPNLSGQAFLDRKDYLQEGIRVVFPNETYLIKDLFFAALVGSDNNAIALLARSTNLSKEEFAAQMNAMAATIGMKGALFVEPTGLDPLNIASAQGVALLLDYASEKPYMSTGSRMTQYVFTPVGSAVRRAANSTDKLLGTYLSRSPYSVNLSKTGYIEEALYCFSLLVSNTEKKASLVGVVLGSQGARERFDEVEDLVAWSLDNYIWYE
ncbi:MAG: D-alanyl-D-alanine endopeptidase (penicillin-binding protein 7) [Parcubacteria group bacterium Gr01-1014_18]|nr:MAG: D-alanyl-D-alanine endopeptidase (penicillin-binding protein 7) [Parcubacteria group bacterium Greene0416_36]TSC81388.1 MAG: D-alanyl-D-alanine endopeptidase (penicillin-binding protein 7) [Parcubacteria group bacterium Gr01-1014_18]TSC99426.1 MAG: D-alanyl-D-alanine endopeptidase (penicillin-binding protein 7) [Parcubacteria group bacterium Greene1014_20]TSD07655.1 MAG: D-alanyl-D-alanine endopeptidase (penicillin-binding protein 7) [Parcubacteria group bacterium Greene0714_2]